MITIMIGITLILIGSILLIVEFPEFEEALKMIDEQPLFKLVFRLVIRVINFICICVGAFILLTLF